MTFIRKFVDILGETSHLCSQTHLVLLRIKFENKGCNLLNYYCLLVTSFQAASLVEDNGTDF